MADDNPFPDSSEKRHLRRVHLAYLIQYSASVGRDLAYFGLPSAEMADVRLWKPVLGHVTAVERSPDVVLSMYRTAQEISVRQRTIVLEGSLVDVCRVLALSDRDAGMTLPNLPPSERRKIGIVRKTPHDVFNLDLCGGFLYQAGDRESTNVETLRHVISFQARHKSPFILILTFTLRDTGADDYDAFIADALTQLAKVGINTGELSGFFAEGGKGQPHQLRRLRFCVPTFLHKIASGHFQARSLGAWSYKTLFHTALFFEPRKSTGALGLTWPPIDELRELLASPMRRVDRTSDDDESVKVTDLPEIPLW